MDEIDVTAQQSAKSGTPQVIDVPRFSATNFTLLGNDLEVGIVCASTMPAANESGEIGIVLVPVAYLSVSPLAAKELAALLTRYVSQLEAKRGDVITSEFLEAAQEA